MLATWNIRGRNNFNKQSSLVSLIKSRKLSLVGILETRVTHIQFEKIWKCLNKKIPGWDVVNNCCCSTMGKIWLIYNKDIVCINVLSIHC